MKGRAIIAGTLAGALFILGGISPQRKEFSLERLVSMPAASATELKNGGLVPDTVSSEDANTYAKTLKEGIELYKQAVKYHNEGERLRVEEGEYGKAVTKYKEAIKKNNEAISEFEKIIKYGYNGKYYKAFLLLGLLNHRMTIENMRVKNEKGTEWRFGETISAFDKASQLNPVAPRLFNILDKIQEEFYYREEHEKRAIVFEKKADYYVSAARHNQEKSIEFIRYANNLYDAAKNEFEKVDKNHPSISRVISKRNVLHKT